MIGNTMPRRASLAGASTQETHWPKGAEIRPMGRRIRRDIHVAGIIERFDNHVLIVLPEDEAASRRWQFPRGAAEAGERPEAAMRRVAKEKLGLFVEIIVGQPPLLCRMGDRQVEMRYFFCGVIGGECQPGPYAEVQWIPKAHLREYDFDDIAMPVVEWLLETGG